MSSENNIQNSATTTTTTAATTTNAPIVITLPQSNESKNEKEKIAKTFPQKIMLALSILQLICGSLAALLQVSLPKYFFSCISIYSIKLNLTEH